MCLTLTYARALFYIRKRKSIQEKTFVFFYLVFHLRNLRQKFFAELFFAFSSLDLETQKAVFSSQHRISLERESFLFITRSSCSAQRKVQSVSQTVMQKGARVKKGVTRVKNVQQKLSLTWNKSGNRSVKPKKVHTHVSYTNYVANCLSGAIQLFLLSHSLLLEIENPVFTVFIEWVTQIVEDASHIAVEPVSGQRQNFI